MYVSKFEIRGIRGAGPKGLTVDLARSAVKARGHLAGWTVIAGPNGYGKTTLLQGIAVSLLGPGAGRQLIGPDDSRWLGQGAATGLTSSWVEAIPDDDGGASSDTSLRPVRLRVEWSGGGGRMIPPRGDHAFVLSQFWDANHKESKPDGWVFVGYGPHRSVQRSSNDAFLLIDRTPPRTSAVVGLFRDDAALEKGPTWLRELAIGERLGDQGRATVLRAVLRLLGHGLLSPGQLTSLQVDPDGQLKVRAPSGELLAAPSLGEGFRMLLSLVLDMLYQIERFKPGRLLEEVLPWVDDLRQDPVVEMSGVVVIDEPENHLHPSLQQHLGFWLKEHFPKIQFIVCTHSALICQAAGKGGLYRMPGPFQVEAVSEETWEAVANGTLDDAIMTTLFGLKSPVAPEGQKLRRALAELERELQQREATPNDRARREELLSQLPNPVDIEVAAALRRLAEMK